MALQELKVTDFRCLEQVALEFGPKYTLIYGPNGSGKTSLLEAIYCLSRGRSFRKTRTDQLVRHGAKSFVLFAQIEDPQKTHRVGFQAGRGLSEVRINGETAPSLAALATTFAAEVIDPEIHGLIADGPDERRRFIDYGVFHVKHDFLSDWRQYRRALKQRNSALRDHRPWSEISVWDEQLIDTASRVDEARKSYVRNWLIVSQESGVR